MVEHHLAKAGVASSSLVSRSSRLFGRRGWALANTNPAGSAQFHWCATRSSEDRGLVVRPSSRPLHCARRYKAPRITGCHRRRCGRTASAATTSGPTRVPDTGSPDWSNAVEAFLRDARSRNCSPATIETTGRICSGRGRSSSCADHRIRSVSDVTAAQLAKLQAELSRPASRPARLRRSTGSSGTSSASAAARAGASAPITEGGAAAPATVEPETYTETEEQRIFAATCPAATASWLSSCCGPGCASARWRR